MSTPDDKPIQFVHRVGINHFAHLRATAESIEIAESARRYLGIDHGHQAITAHKQAVEAVRSIARRRGEPAWRLIGLVFAPPPLAEPATLPSFEDFIAERDLDGWSEIEVAEMYAEAYPQDKTDRETNSQDRKTQRRARLRARQLDLLRRLETVAAEQPEPSDLVSGWFDDVTAGRLIGAGIDTLGQLHERIHVGGRWYSTMPGIGALKAERIAMFLDHLLPGMSRPERVFFPLEARVERAGGAAGGTGDGVMASTVGGAFSEVPSVVFSAALSGPALISVKSDLEAVEAWIAARSGSVATEKSYRRESQRLLLWLRHERAGKSFSQMDVDDCSRFQQFLADVPSHWISRARCAPGAPGWAPFRGKLSAESRKQTLSIVCALFSWLQSVRYLSVNPWVLVNTKIGDTPDRKVLESKAFSEPAMQGFLDFIDAQPPSPSSNRMRFILRFVEAVGLRSAELLGAKLDDLQLEPEGWVLNVHGKGAKNRVANVPAQAYEALQAYLAQRGLGSLQVAPTDAPLVASLLDPISRVGYQALYESARAWVSKFVAGSNLPTSERLKLSKASMHWLRHTFGTRSIARGVPLDVIQAQMGHASVDTTASIYGRAPLKRRSEELGKAFGGG